MIVGPESVPELIQCYADIVDAFAYNRVAEVFLVAIGVQQHHVHPSLKKHLLEQLLWVLRHQYQIFYYVDPLEYTPNLRPHRSQISWGTIPWVAL